MTITLIQFLVFTAYLGFILIKFKRVLPSISNSWYELQGLQKTLFTLFCWTLGILMLFQTNNSTGLFFLSGVGLCFTGTAGAFKQSMVKTIHFTGAIVAIFGAFLALYFERGVIDAFVLFSASTVLLWHLNNRTWWIEVSAFFFIMYGLI